ncbi:MAG TPA: hypothetical protein VFS83_07800 [Ktedonobacterales bacterium]|nr:hypothetical protein [Ktedonobacterales bacterium]
MARQIQVNTVLALDRNNSASLQSPQGRANVALPPHRQSGV